MESSTFLLLDSSPPVVGEVYDGPPSGDVDYWTDAHSLTAHWRGFEDPHSSIVEYWWAIGTCDPSCQDIQAFVGTGLKQGQLL